MSSLNSLLKLKKPFAVKTPCLLNAIGGTKCHPINYAWPSDDFAALALLKGPKGEQDIFQKTEIL
jgi:hypothetical protein